MTRLIVVDKCKTKIINSTREDFKDITFHNIRGIKIVKNNEYSDLETPIDIDINKAYFLLYILYHDGDTCNSHDGQIDFIEIYDNQELAEKNSEIIKNCDKKNQSLIISNSLDQEYSISCPEFDCFTQIEEVVVQIIRVI